MFYKLVERINQDLDKPVDAAAVELIMKMTAEVAQAEVIYRYEKYRDNPPSGYELSYWVGKCIRNEIDKAK